MTSEDTSIRELMTSPVRTVARDRTVAHAAETLCEDGIGSLLVTDTDTDAIVTKTDLTCAMASGIDPESTPVRAVMTSPIITASPTATVREAAERMNDRGIKRLPVANQSEYIGIVTTTDVVDHVAPGLDDIIGMFAADG
ncbi:MAG: cyclic nucleotide-binding/CBS domain-containing protein [Salinirussus sp.]